MKAPSLQPAFLVFLALSVAACRSGIAPNIGLDVSALPKAISISSKLTPPPQPEYSAATDTVLVTLPSMVE